MRDLLRWPKPLYKGHSSYPLMYLSLRAVFYSYMYMDSSQLLLPHNILMFIPQAVPGPGKYELRSQFRTGQFPDKEDEEPDDMDKAPFGAREKV